MIAAVVAAWLFVALVLTVAMSRRGHDPFQWALLGAVLGPLAIPLAVAHREKVVSLPVDGTASTEPGRVLVGVRPGIPVADVAGALARVASAGGAVPVTLVTVLDAEACERPAGGEAIAEATAFLDDVATALVDAGLASMPVPRCVLFGDPATTLAAFARDNGCRLIVVGAGEPITRRLMHGSMRTRLLRMATVPVLCVPGYVAGRHRRASVDADTVAAGGTG